MTTNRSTPHHTIEDFPGAIGRTLADSEPFFEQEAHPGDDAPNVVMVLLDDTGFAQFGCFGSDIETPHVDGTEAGRYHDTRFWRFPVPRFFLQSMPTHVVHHLYPTIPHWDEPKALEALRPFMIERGVPGADEIPDRVRFNPLLGRSPVRSCPRSTQ